MKEKGKRKKEKSIKMITSSIFSTALRLCGLISLLVFAAFPQSDGSQQNLTGRAGTFAITNTRIVTVSGATIENGTVVIQNGKIASVGANVTVPGGAERI